MGLRVIAKFSARKEILTPPELHLVKVHGIRIRFYRALHGFHGLFSTAEFVIRARHLIEHLVAILILWVLLEQLFIKSDCLKGTFGSCVSSRHFRRRGSSVAAGRDLALRSCALLEFLIGFPTAGFRDRGGLVGSAERFARRRLSGFWSRHWFRLRLSLARVYSVFLLEFQVRETPDCLGCHWGFR